MNGFRKFLISITATALFFAPFVYQADAVAPGPKVSEVSATGTGNKHNLSAKARPFGGTSYSVPNPNLYKAVDDPVANPGGQQICIFCHTPHNANVEGGAPLWNRAFSTQVFSRYSSQTLQIRVNPAARTPAAYDAPAWQPDGASKLCLSCHDGVATNPLGAVLRGGPITMTGGDYISSNTSVSWASFNPSTNKMKFGHHPISFVYNDSVASAINTGKGVSSYVMPTLAGVKLDKNSKIQCTTCHDAHQNQSHDDQCYGGSGDCTGGQANTRKKAPFWVYGGGGSASADQQAVCLTCHPMTTPAPWPP